MFCLIVAEDLRFLKGRKENDEAHCGNRKEKKKIESAPFALCISDKGYYLTHGTVKSDR